MKNLENKDGKEVFQALGAEIPLQPVVKTMVRQAVPLQPMKVHGGVDIHLLSTEEPSARAGGCPKEAMTPWKACAGS
ncbi:hypothetical protein BTVI_69188 [Pitangus sulphuratus]|nr:hypothetical protein BTVI_69188 [Pitangus sulphuratus]